MRLVADIPHPHVKITLFSWNGKYLLKLERGPYEQTYKVNELDVSGDEEVKAMLTEEFLANVAAIFKQMHENLQMVTDNF